MLIKKKLFNYNNLINILIAAIPLSLILGNLIVNINIILICILGVAIYKFNTFQINRKKYQYLIYSFFLYLILITLYQNLPNLNESTLYKEHIIKSVLFLRFLILFLVINKLIERNEFKINFFIITCAFLSLLIGIDIIIQSVFGKNIIGLSITNFRPSSFFGSENIAGGFLQKFSLFFIFFASAHIKKYNTNFIILFFFFLFFIIISLTANKMPFLLFGASIALFLLINKKIKQLLVMFIFFVFFSIGLIQYNLDETKNNSRIGRLSTDYGILYKSVKRFLDQALNKSSIEDGSKTNIVAHNYNLHFNTGIEIWKTNQIFGSGLKSFRIKCTYENNQTCNTHPHNYLIEILIDVGLFGFTLIYLIFIFSVVDYFKFYKTNSSLKLLSIPFFLIIFFEFFPIRSSGSFFTTNNAVVIFLMLAILVGLPSLKNLKKN